MREAADDDLIHYPRARTPRAWLCDAVDRLAGADPGLNQLREAARGRLDGQREPLRPLVRDVDAATPRWWRPPRPLRPVTFGRNSTQLTEILVVSSAARQYARSLAALMEEGQGRRGSCRGPSSGSCARPPSSCGPRPRRSRTASQPVSTAATSAPRPSSRSPFRQSPLAQALHDFTLLDGALARLATALRMDIDDHDTGQPADEAIGLDVRPPM